jgi:hypothetical protein
LMRPPTGCPRARTPTRARPTLKSVRRFSDNERP